MPTWNSNLLTTISTGDLVAVSTYLQPVADNIWCVEAFYKRPIVYDLNTSGLSYTATSYTAGSTWLYLIPANIARASTVYLEAVMSSSNASGTTYAKLRVGGSEVSGSEISVAGTTPTRVRSGDLASLLTGTSEVIVEAVVKSNSGSYTTVVNAIRLIVVPI